MFRELLCTLSRREVCLAGQGTRRTSSPFDSAVVNVSATPVSAQSLRLPTPLPCQPLIPTTTTHTQGQPPFIRK
eukprot:1637880-Amphidinium_carterae.1